MTRYEGPERVWPVEMQSAEGQTSSGWTDTEISTVWSAVMDRWPGDLPRAAQVCIYGQAAGLTPTEVLTHVNTKEAV